MATGIQTGIRTGSTPLPTGKGPAGGGGGLGKFVAMWTAMSTKMKVIIIGSFLLLGGGGLVAFAYTATNKPVALYATNLSPADVMEISRRLNENGEQHSIEAGKIMVHPSKRSQLVGMLLSYGLPHRALTVVDAGGAMTPKTEFEKKQQSIVTLENELIDQIRQFEVVADAYVKLVPQNEDALPSDRQPAKANVFLALKPGSKPSQMQIEAIVNLVAFSVNGLTPENVKVVDKTGYVWNDGTKIARGPGGSMSSGGGGGDDVAFENENLAIKKAYESAYSGKISNALNGILGEGNYQVTVDADIDFTQTKIESTQVGEPGGNNSVVTLKKTDKEVYTNDPTKDGKKAGASQVSIMSGGDKSGDTKYEKVKYEQKVEHGRVTKTALIQPGVIKKLTATLAVSGKRDQAELAKLQQVVNSAIGYDSSRGDVVNVVDLNFNQPAEVMAGQLPAGFGTGGSSDRRGGNNTPQWLMYAMLAPTALLLLVLAVFLVKQRKVTADKTGLILATGPGATTSDISDLLSDKIGRSTAASQTTKVNNTEQLEKLAKEKPTKVAELLKSTWLSDKER